MSGFLPGVRTRLCTSAFKTPRHVFRPLNSTAQLSKAEYYSSRQDLEPTNEPEGGARKNVSNVSKTNELAVDSIGAFDKPLQESQEEGEKKRQLQSPNRKNVWSRSQMPREMAMTGPRFEQTIMEYQPQPYAAIELIHKQPVRWVDTRTVACDGGGGPLGHPRIFINVDKPQICWCTYCGLPYAHTHHKKHIESLPSTTYPLKPTGDPAEVQMPQTPSMMGQIDGQYAKLKGEVDAEGGEFSQR